MRVASIERIVRYAAIMALSSGMVLVGHAGYEEHLTGFRTRSEQSTLRRQFARTAPSPWRAGSTVRKRPPPPPVAAKHGAAVGRLIIPKLRLDLIVVEGVGKRQLAKGPGHYPGTDPVGSGGVVAIAGHRTGWGSPFEHLDRLKRGDMITLVSQTNVSTYEVTGSIVTRPSETWVLRGDPSSKRRARLVLTTCTPKGSDKLRLIVWADLIGQT